MTLYTKAAYVDVVEVEGARVYTFRASTASVDRQNEVIDQGGWELDSYRANPVVLDSHKYDSVYDVIGRSVRTEVVNGALEVDIIFADDDVEELVSKGFLRTVSVGFRSLARRPGSATEPVTHTRMELLEVSLVAIPANREAVRIRSHEKAGRRVSKSTAEVIMQAIDLLQSLLEDQSPDVPPMEQTMPNQDMCKPKPKPKTELAMKPDEEIHGPSGEPKKPKKSLEVEPGIVAALTAFAEEK